MNGIYTFVFLMFIAVLLVGVAQKIKIPYPIALVLGGGALSFIPGPFFIDFDPHVLLVIVLPPILFYASYSISSKEFIRYFRDIFSLAIGLVIATTCIVGLLFKWLFPDLSWPLAWAFGALISPPDAVAATAILKRFGITPRLQAILEGESLINDATSLVIYRFAVIALMTGSFSIKTIPFQIFYVVVGGIALGLALGYILNKISALLSPALAVVYSFVIPYITYCLADFMGLSGVLAVVSCGLLGARMLSTQFTSLTRILGWASWDILIILLNCFIFILIGLEFRYVLTKMSLQEILLYSGYGVLMTLAIIIMRILWIYGRRLSWHWRIRKNLDLVRQNKVYMLHAIISSWAGMRGIVSLTAALALPLSLPNGIPLAGREIVIFLTFEIIFLTLVIPGLTLPLLIKWLNIQPLLLTKELSAARKKLADLALKEIDRLYALKHLDEEGKTLLSSYFNSRHKIMELFTTSEEHQIEQARHRILQKQRELLLDMWVQNEVTDTLMSQLERELDIEDVHLARGEIS
jgi:monovalent cation/hydrogen antiporter